ncbi:ATP phosphoribosyltransferase regulatory subunit [Candidatus Gracilibacteria bacterium]|nr:ATP phosphoribosyltransferase regulatory subunit [Candidatus Gracilibacteria bacterium]
MNPVHMVEQRHPGMLDMLPADHNYLTFLKKVFRHEFRKNGFRRISTPLIEEESLLRKVYPKLQNQYGLYYFDGKSGEKFSLIPTETVGIMRAYIENEIYDELQPVYYYYMERTYRQNRSRKEFYTIGGEVIGESDPIIDAQSVYMAHTIFQKIGLTGLRLEINSYGSEKEMLKYKEELSAFYENKLHLLSDTTKEYIKDDILRVFESDDEDEKILAETSPDIHKFFKKDTKKDFSDFVSYLDNLNIDYTVNKILFFRENIYTGVTWRYIDENGHTVVSGGRYDTLASKLGSVKHYPASGFHYDTLYIIESLKARNIAIKNKDQIDLYFVQLGDEAKRIVFPLSLEARARGINTQASLGTPSMKEQMLKAHRIGAKYVVLVGVMEARNGIFQVRNLEDGTQEEVKKEDIIDYIIEKIGADKLDFYEPSRDLLQR